MRTGVPGLARNNNDRITMGVDGPPLPPPVPIMIPMTRLSQPTHAGGCVLPTLGVDSGMGTRQGRGEALEKELDKNTWDLDLVEDCNKSLHQCGVVSLRENALRT